MLIKLRKGQSTAEYAVIIGIVVGAAVAMQTYVRRSLQARQHSAALAFTEPALNMELNGIQAPVEAYRQYEPYYTVSQRNLGRASKSHTDVSDQYSLTSQSKSFSKVAVGGYEEERGYIGRGDTYDNDQWGVDSLQ